ncbi:transcriptional regulator, TetR family protein [Minicystis rosea]|nr:transcriptional regulator, TetR family protein [Minicystis rosea]
MSSELSPKASEIVACAQSLLAAGGYNGFSYADISEAVHISKPSVHHHFPSKVELVRTVVKQYREAARAGMAALERQIADPLAQLHAYTGYWAACIRDGTAPFCICAMLAAEMPAIPAEVAEEVRGHFADLAAWLEAVLERGAADGLFHLRSPAKAEAMAVMAAVHGAMLAARAHGDPELFGTIVKPVLHRLTHR